MAINLTTSQLSALEALAEFRHFTNAADKLGITQSALSQQIKSLEHSVGLPLINRDTRPLTMTDIGERLLGRAKLILQQTRSIEAELLETELLKQGNLSFGIIPTIAPFLTSKILPPFIAAHPEIKLKIHEDTTKELARKVHQGHLDLAITSDLNTLDKSVASHFEEIPLFNEKLYTVSPTMQDSGEENYMLTLKDGHCLRDQTLAYCDPTIEHRIVCDQIATLLSLIESGVGSAIIPSMAVPRPIPPSISVEEITDASRSVQLITRPSTHPNPAAKVFIESISNTLESLK
ncbi:LysR family transcriptional regulator [Rubritalea marina]|uniref:LysR family transcriptional regulator n=1 Tax=Rubritalea marina TaxID=361055 RepID=UPI000360527D|nr:LysR substrate-binding domain-containing protein [Rubritalea marina]